MVIENTAAFETSLDGADPRAADWGLCRLAYEKDSCGFGLIAMRQRVSRLAGQLEIESEPGAGTAVSASLPAISLGPSPQATKAGESK